MNPEITKLEAEIIAIQKRIEKLKTAPWRPEGGDYRATIRSSCAPEAPYFRVDVDTAPWGNETFARFPTQERAERAAKHLEFYMKLLSLADHVNKGARRASCYVSFVHGQWGCERYSYTDEPTALFASEEAAKAACEIMNREGWRLPA